MQKSIHEGAIVRLSIGMLLTMGSGLVLITAWLITLSVQRTADAQEIETLRADVKAVQRIDRRLARIEGALGLPPERGD